MRRSTWIVIFASLSLVVGGGCLPDRCKTLSGDIELEVEFKGFSSGAADRIEFETMVEAESINAHSDAFRDTRLSSIDWASGSGMRRTYRIDTGSYLGLLPNDMSASRFRVRIRVYGRKGGTDEVLLAEGSFSIDHPSNHECYIQRSTKVTAKGTCREKQEGDPCVAPDGSHLYGVCRAEGDGFTCQASWCGDGYTDRRAGELCDSPDSGSCTADCLTRPLQVDVGDPSIHAPGSIQGSRGDLTTMPGYWSVGADIGEREPVGQILVGDVDGDGFDELVLGVPGARDPDLTCASVDGCSEQKVGAAFLMDDPFVAGMRYGEAGGANVSFFGPYVQSRDLGTWFGSSLALGDVDGDGYKDLVVGAPHFQATGTNTGAFYLFYGGTGRAIPPPGAEHPTVWLEEKASPAIQLFVGEEGPFTNGNESQPGDQLGYSVVVADFDLDGIADIAVSAPHRKLPSVTSMGEVYLLRGGEGMQPTGSDWRTISSEARYHVTVGLAGTDRIRLGTSMAVGDVDGDGIPDLVMGTASADASEFFGGVAVLFGDQQLFEQEGSSVQVFPAVASGPHRSGTVSLQASAGSPMEGIGGTVQVVDVNGDGYGDVVSTLGRRGIGADSSTVALVDGRFFAAQRSAQTALLEPPADQVTYITGPVDAGFGLALGAVDASGDRRPDLLIGAPMDSFDGRVEAGSIYILLASPRAEWWRAGGETIDVVSLRGAPDVAPDPNVPLIWLRGSTDGGHLGVSAAGSSHLAEASPGLEHPNAYTYVFEPGIESGDYNPNGGNLSAIFLPALLPCEMDYPCLIR